MVVESSSSGEQRVVTVTDDSGVLGWIVVDTEVAGRARGGLRLVADVCIDELREAAHAMTLKYGLLGFPHGGAKAGVVGDAESGADEKRRLLQRFAEAVAPLLRERVYIPDADLGTESDDIARMLESVGAPLAPRDRSAGLSGQYTAASCLAAAAASLAYQGRSLEGCRTAIEGFGSVGASLAGFLSQRGAVVVAVSTSRGAVYDPRGLDVGMLSSLSGRFGSAFVDHYEGAERLDRAELLELQVDLLCPCARLHSINDSNVDRVRAGVVCPGANNPLTDTAENRLASTGVIIPPDFVANCGGVLGGTLEFAGVHAERIASMVEIQVASMVESLLRRAEESGDSLRATAENDALERHRRVKDAAESPSLTGRILSAGLELYRRGWVPPYLLARLAPRYLEGLSTK